MTSVYLRNYLIIVLFQVQGDIGVGFMVLVLGVVVGCYGDGGKVPIQAWGQRSSQQLHT